MIIVDRSGRSWNTNKVAGVMWDGYLFRQYRKWRDAHQAVEDLDKCYNATRPGYFKFKVAPIDFTKIEAVACMVGTKTKFDIAYEDFCKCCETQEKRDLGGWYFLFKDPIDGVVYRCPSLGDTIEEARLKLYSNFMACRLVDDICAFMNM